MNPFRPVLQEREGREIPLTDAGVYSFKPGKKGSAVYYWSISAFRNTKPKLNEIRYGVTPSFFREDIKTKKLISGIDYRFFIFGGGGNGSIHFRIEQQGDSHTIFVMNCPGGNSHLACIAK